jgi:hypothetical protein
MHNLITLVPLFALAISFACGYGVREWISRRRRREARKKTETLTIAVLHERLGRLEDRIASTTLEIEAFRDEGRSEFVATRELLERKFEDSQYSGRVLDARRQCQRDNSDAQDTIGRLRWGPLSCATARK